MIQVGCYPKGGLGNSMHTYATARAMALHNDAELYIDKSYYDNPSRPYPFPYELDNFSIEAPIRKRHGTQIKEAHYHYDPGLIRKHDKDIFLDGYFQSEKYFKHIRDVLLGDFTPKRRLSHLAMQWERTIKECDYPVAVHFRRGERVNEPTARRMHGLIDMSYYTEARDIIQQENHKATLFAFSDDPAWVAGNAEVKWIVHGLPAHEDLHLMGMCKGAIIANSSFSWWGGWLQRPGGLVVAPDPWDKTGRDNTKDVLPERWIKIKTKYL